MYLFSILYGWLGRCPLKLDLRRHPASECGWIYSTGSSSRIYSPGRDLTQCFDPKNANVENEAEAIYDLLVEALHNLSEGFLCDFSEWFHSGSSLDLATQWVYG